MIYQKTLALLLICCLTVSMLWCIDSHDVNINYADQRVVSLDGSSAHDQNAPSHSGDNHNENCSCICHVPSMQYKNLLLSYSPSVEIVTISISSHILSVPGNAIFRPPIAA